MNEKILILVKTYPTFSKKYFEVVCTAGINKAGEWRRIYPIPFRELSDLEKYKKYQWVEVDMENNPSDSRPESFKLLPGKDIQPIDEPISTQNNWLMRKDALSNTPIYKDIATIIYKANKENSLSLCQFRPKEILEFKIESCDKEWSQVILNKIESENAQDVLFADMKREIRLVRKLPYKFSYTFIDFSGKKSTLMIEDWEIGQLYWNCLKRANRDERKACEQVKDKYQRFIENNEVTLFLGTTRQFHGRAKNPFVIIGVFYPPKVLQPDLF
ncbi:MAG: hypothetical protein ACR2N8_01165 [Parvibaculales bacterium]